MEEKRTRTVAVRLDGSEYSSLRVAAGLAGRVQMGRYLREAALAFALELRGPRRGVDVELGVVRSGLTRVGSNLNQAVMLAHVDGQVDRLGPAVEQCGRQLARIADELERQGGEG